MNITYRSQSCGNLLDDLADSVLFLDTTALIAASAYSDFYNFLMDVNDHGCQLYIIPSVRFEFTRMAKSAARLKEYQDLIEGLGITIYPSLEKRIQSINLDDYLMVYNDCVNKGRSLKKAPSYTDSLLCILLYTYRHSQIKVKLMTSNYTDMPIQFFNREDLITVDAQTEIHVEGIYSFNNENFEREMTKFKKANQIA